MDERKTIKLATKMRLAKNVGSVLADSLVLRNPLIRQAPKRYTLKTLKVI
jgi:hypothetical protein